MDAISLVMKFGVCIPNYGEMCSVEALRASTIEAEKLGYDSVWTTDHLLMPVHSGTPYEKIFESVTTLAYLSSFTNRVKLGISSLVMGLRNPVVVAKQLAAIDQFSGGRIMLATGAGWFEQEFAHTGTNFHDRGRRLNESIKLIRLLWNGGEGLSFEGKALRHRVVDAVFDPKPVQSRLTIFIAGNSKAAMQRAVKFGDGWHPNAYPLDVFEKHIAEFRALPGAKDKEVCVRIALNTKAERSDYVSPQGERRLILSGNLQENRVILQKLEKMGVGYAILATNFDGNRPLKEQLESMKIFAEEFIHKPA